ncbi:MAG: gliding motility-associated protein GldE [Prevotellaceae bacterium]|nr:gliding motility-associated protein GldE [Prevotellaceae bacterium]
MEDGTHTLFINLLALNPDLAPDTLIGQLLIILLLLLVSAVISGSETAYFSLTPGDIRNLQNSHQRTAQMALQLLQKPDYLLSSILLGNNAVNIAMVILSTLLSNQTFMFGSEVVRFIFDVVIITFILLLCGEITPKIFATYNAPRLARFMSYPLMVLVTIAKPFSWILVRTTARVNQKIGHVKKGDNISINDLSSALNVTHTGSAEDRKMLKGIATFGNIDVREIMTPRIDVAAVEISTSFHELRELIIKWEYSRMPIYEDNLDNIKGMLYTKDLLKYMDEADDFEWKSLIRPAYFVPEHKKINDLLEEFRQQKNHLAIVVDEYGGTFGIVTLEDILEEIVGEITDESDLDEHLFSRQSDGTYLFEGKTMLNDFCKVMSIPDDYFDEARGEAETLAGLLLEVKGEFPSNSEDIRYKKFTFRVASFEGRRIQKIRVTVDEAKTKNKPKKP